MHITHITGNDPSDADALSGTLFHISNQFKCEEDIELKEIYIRELQKILPAWHEFVFRLKKIWSHVYHRTYLAPEWHTPRALHIAKSVESYLKHTKTDVILSVLAPATIAHVETHLPIVHWTDHVYAAIANFYPHWRLFHADSHWDGANITNLTLHKAKLLIFSSEWAARTAKEFYGISEKKIHVVPFGANLTIAHQHTEIKEIIRLRSKTKIKLLFVGSEWHRKGGDIVLQIAKVLHEQGNQVEVTLVGQAPDKAHKLPAYITYVGRLSKSKPEDVEKLKQLYRDSHFLIVPSRADCTPMVFPEANAFGLPCITTFVGGIPTIIKDNINGMTFSLEATYQHFCDYIVNMHSNYSAYEALCLSSFNEYKTRLNWPTAINQVKKLIKDII